VAHGQNQLVQQSWRWCVFDEVVVVVVDEGVRAATPQMDDEVEVDEPSLSEFIMQAIYEQLKV